MLYSLTVTTYGGKTESFENIDLRGGRRSQNGICVTIVPRDNCCCVTAECSAGDKIRSMEHTVTIGLRNFSTIIKPDGGREYSAEWHPVKFWGMSEKSGINNVRIPLYICNGMDSYASFAFGVAGKEYETSFACLQPNQRRALMAYYRKFTLSIRRGDIPESYTSDCVEESLYIRDFQDSGVRLPWTAVLDEFCGLIRSRENIVYEHNKAALEPLWCSWTDWFSDEVTEQVIIDNVREGMKLGIKNYIIDDGWFGPGLDNDFDVGLNIGDWRPDPSKIKNMRALNDKIHSLGAKSVIWCAPHAVGELAECRRERRHLLVSDKSGSVAETYNKFNVMCVRSPEAREVMSDICLRLAVEYNTDGAKYDLFNCIPDIKCCSCQHTHDTESEVEGLERLLELIYRKIKAVKPDYMIELKQNYAGVKLSQYGTMIRAGDTPYAPDGNFYRTAYIQGYSPYASNDYQTITDFNTLKDSTKIVIKMLAVGIPTYSVNIPQLREDTKAMLRFLNGWYSKELAGKGALKRNALNGALNTWKISREDDDVYFTIDTASRIDAGGRSFTVLNGSNERVCILGNGSFLLKEYSCTGDVLRTWTADIEDGIEINDDVTVLTGSKIN